MPTPQTSHPFLDTVGRSACAAFALAALAGCVPRAAWQPPVAGGAPVAGDVLSSGGAIGGVLVGASGELIVVDAGGRPAPPCRLAEAERTHAGTATQVPECAKLVGTTVTRLQSVGVLGHTGSHCVLIGPFQTVSAGGVVTTTYYQLPPGCRH